MFLKAVPFQAAVITSKARIRVEFDRQSNAIKIFIIVVISLPKQGVLNENAYWGVIKPNLNKIFWYYVS